MDNGAYELEVVEKGIPKNGNLARLENHGNGDLSVNHDEQPPVVEEARRRDDERLRYEEVKRVAQTGNGLRLDELLSEWAQHGWLRDWRNDEGVTLYADAITDGFTDIINVLLSHDVPIGDTLIRAIDVEFGDAVEAICHYLETRKELCESVLSSNCDNDDYHPAVTPLVLAAQRNNFDTVQRLVQLGATLDEPNISAGGDVTLTQATSFLNIYRALSQPAYILATKTDVFGHAFEMGKKLKTLSNLWEDFGAEYEEMARGIEVFAGEMLGQSSSTEEILGLFQYHNTDKYRNIEGKQHPLSKVFEAIKYQQKEFIAHPHSQKAIIAQFYQNLLSWNEKGLLHQILLTLFVMLGYPIICIMYILFPFPKVVKFARLPYVMMLMKAASGITFLAFIFAITIMDRNKWPQAATTLDWLLLIWTIGLMWLHIKIIMKQGAAVYLTDSANLHEAVIIILYVAVFLLQWNGQVFIAPNVMSGRPRREVNGTFLNNESYSALQTHVTLALNGLHGQLEESVVEGVNVIITSALSGCRSTNTTGNSYLTPAATDSPLSPSQQETIEYDGSHPVIVAHALFGVAVTVSFLRLMNLLLVSDTVGPLRISLGAMTGDFLKFIAIFIIVWLAFAIGLYQTYRTSATTAQRMCYSDGGGPDDCANLVGFSTFGDSLIDLYWSLYGSIELDVLVLPAQYSLAESIGTALFFVYHIAAVLVLLNALIGMLSNTYNLVEEHADTEWKFHRAELWMAFLHPVGTLPPPFNLIPSTKSIFRFLRYIVGIWLKCAKRKIINRKRIHEEKELSDYKRVMALIRSRYIQGNLSVSSLNTEGIRPRDIQTLRNDVMAFRFFALDRLETIDKSLKLSNEKSNAISKKLGDLVPLNEHVSTVLNQSSDLTDNTDELKVETSDLVVEQETELLERDQITADMRSTMAALRAEIEEMKRTHSADIEEKMRQEGSLSHTIQILQKEKAGLNGTIHSLKNDKAELATQVGQLNVEIIRLSTQVPPEPKGKDEPDVQPQKPVRRGIVRRIADIIEDKLIPQDETEGAKGGAEKEQKQKSETKEERPQDLQKEENLEQQTTPIQDHETEASGGSEKSTMFQQEQPDVESETKEGVESADFNDLEPGLDTPSEREPEYGPDPNVAPDVMPEQPKDPEESRDTEQDKPPQRLGIFQRISNFIQGTKDENSVTKTEQSQKLEDELHPRKESDQEFKPATLDETSLQTKSTPGQESDGQTDVEPENLTEARESQQEPRPPFGQDVADRDAMESEQQQDTDEHWPEEAHQQVPPLKREPAEEATEDQMPKPSEKDDLQTQADAASQKQARVGERLEQESEEDNTTEPELSIINQDKHEVTRHQTEEEPEEQERTEPYLYNINKDMEQKSEPTTNEEPNDKELPKPVQTELKQQEQETLSSDVPSEEEETEIVVSKMTEDVEEREQEPEPGPREEPEKQEITDPVEVEVSQDKDEKPDTTPEDAQQINEPTLREENQGKEEEEPETMSKEDFEKQEETKPVTSEVNHEQEQKPEPTTKEEPDDKDLTKPVQSEVNEQEQEEQASILSDVSREKEETDSFLSEVNNEQEPEPIPRGEPNEQEITEPVEAEVSQDEEQVQEPSLEEDQED